MADPQPPLYRVPIRDGTEQRERRALALDGDYFQVDEQAFEHLLMLCARFAQSLSFTTLDNEPRGSWLELFGGDDGYLFAWILSIDGPRLQREFHLALERGRPSEARRLMARIVRALDVWVRDLGRSEAPAARALYLSLTQIIRSHLVQFMRQEVLPDELDLAQLQPVWRAEGGGGLQVRWHSTLGANAGLQQVRSDFPELRSCFLSLLNAVSHLQSSARARLPEVLETGTHDPSLGLLFAFLQLTSRVQGEVNRFTHRHLNFYYREVLGLGPREAQPDHALLVLALDPRQVRTTLQLPAGAAFLARDGAGQDRLYRSEQATTLVPAKVEALQSWRFERDPLVSPERELGYVSAVVSEALAHAGDRPLVMPPRALFGGRAGMVGGNLGRAGPSTASFGFAVATPTLALGEGERQVTLGLSLADPQAHARAVEVLQALACAEGVELTDTAAQYIAQRVREAGAAPEALLRRVLDDTPTRPLTLEDATRSLAPLMNDPADGLGWFEAQMAALAMMTSSAPTKAEFFRLFGRAYGRYLLTGEGMLAQASMRGQVRQRARAILDPVEDRFSLEVIDELLDSSWEDAFYRYCRELFTVSLTGADGWIEVHDYLIVTPDRSGRARDLELVFSLDPEVAPIVPWQPELHGGAFDGLTQPLMRLAVRPDAALHPISIFEGLVLRAVDVDVDVRGVSSLTANTQLGPVSTADQFAPFGPLPAVGAYLAVGCAEAAGKAVTAMDLHIEWANLPHVPGGFDNHYGAYPERFGNRSFTVTTAALRDGEWVAPPPASRTRMALFDVDEITGRPRPRRRLAIEGVEHLRPQRPGEVTSPRAFTPRAGNGFIRLELAGPEGAFGHATYPSLLAQVLTENARERRLSRAKPVPNPPYTPLINRLTLDYQATTRILLDSATVTSTQSPQSLYHLLPGGVERIYPSSTESGHSLLPTIGHDGHLAIGLRADSLSGQVSLLFRLADDALADAPQGPAKVQWSYLVGDRWCALSPRQVLVDTTQGFLTSGIVTLDVPAQIDRAHRAMADGLYWLRASTDAPSERFAQLVGVSVNAISVVRELDDGEGPASALPAGSIDRLASPMPGVSAVLQPDASRGGRHGEDQRAFETRVSERLRHRARAVQPWDYERLVLEAFPEVFKVKCFSAMAEHHGEPVVRPGQVLVVVVPEGASTQGQDSVERGLQGAALAQIREYLQARSPAFARVRVRNPIYERIQVRCTVKLAPGAHAGQEIARINHTISRYISPWEQGGYGAAFGWRMRRQDLEAVIRALDTVEFVTDFSMLHITRDASGHYRMDDTARAGDDWIRPRYPWSLALPMAEHYVELVDDYREISPRVTGIGELQVGSTMIVAPDTVDESEESSR